MRFHELDQITTEPYQHISHNTTQGGGSLIAAKHTLSDLACLTMEVVLEASCVLSLLTASTADYRISLDEVSTLYLPQNNSRFDMTYVQKASYDVSTNMLHVTGKYRVTHLCNIEYSARQK